MNNNIYIPKRINVGYQNRKDTYTGKIAYVTINEQIQNIAQKKDTLCRRMYN